MNDRVGSNGADTEAGDGKRLDRLFAFVYEELREIAHRQLLDERSDQTLSTTALVHEAYLRLATDAASRRTVAPTSSPPPRRRCGGSSSIAHAGAGA